MTTGEKIKKLRTEKMMTQSQLVGDQITRNMLSLIENGSALPSLPTVIYLSERLDVPVGLLLANEEEELIYLKMSNLPKIKQAYSKGEYRLCADMCESLLDTNGESLDDELLLILAECHFGIAVEEFNFGRLHSSSNEFDEACSYAKKTIYNGEHILCSAAVYFEYMRKLSPSLISEGDNELYFGSSFCGDAFCKYFTVLKALSNGDKKLAEDYILSTTEAEKGFADHIRAEIDIINGNFASAKSILNKLIDGDYLSCRTIMYDIFKSMESCCRELGDYKRAYEYSVGKVELLEYMLK